MGCIHSLATRRIKDHQADPGGSALRTDPEVLPEILQLAERCKAVGHAFTEKRFKRGRMCDVCKQTIESSAAFCKECKVAVHKVCKAKVSTTCASTPDQHNSIKSASLKKRGSMPRSEEQVMEQVMEHHFDIDLTYITERIISVFFMPELEEQRYHRELQEMATMLKSKHQDKFLLLNLSEKRHDITKLIPKVQDFGWPDLHAPPLDRICTVCKAMEMWLSADPNNVAVLHCKGNKGKTGVIVAAYMHYSKISAGADQALTTLTMRKFCEDKVSSSLQPSQNRYIYYFGGLLSGAIKMNSSPLFLHQILIPSLPNFQTGGGYFPFLKIYQSLELIYTSCVYDPQTSRSRKLCVMMEPALLLKGDIMVKCYHRRSQAAEREVVFRIQFHTCTIHGAQLWFGKKDLDVACTDDRFPHDAAVEFILASRPEKINENQKTDASINVNYNTSDPVVRWDSYENLNLPHQDSPENISHTRGPLDGSLYAQVRKRRGPGPASSPNGYLTSSPTVKTQIANQSQTLTITSSCVLSDHIEHHSPFTSHPESETTKSLMERRGSETRGKVRGKERDRETEILENANLSNLGGLRREHSCCGRAGVKCGAVERQWEQEPCLSNGHCAGCCNSIKKHPKSQTLPALPSKSVSPLPHLTHMELCHRHSVHPLPELAWERQAPSVPCLHRPCFHYSSPEHAHSHGHTLPASNRHYNDECQVFHYPGQAPTSHLSQQSLLSSPYREMFFGPPNQSPGCPCRECSSRREHQAASVRVHHSMHPDQAVGLQQTGEALWESKNPWEVPREADFCQCKSAVPPFHICHSAALNQGTPQPRFFLGPHQSYPSTQPLINMRDGASSGYHTPPPPHQSYPCPPYQSSPVESHGSRGYVSGYLSGSASPLPAKSPSPGRVRLPDTPPGAKDQQQEHLEVEKATPSPEVDISQGSEGKHDCSSTQTLDSDHDYTVIGGSSPPHTEDSSSQEASIAPEFNTNGSKTLIIAETEEQSQSSNVTPSSELSQSRTSDGQLEETKVKENDEDADQTQSTTIIITPVEDQLNVSSVTGDGQFSSSTTQGARPGPSNNPFQYSPIESPSHSSPSATDPPGHRLTPERDSSTDTKPPSPVPDGYHTPTFPLAPYYYSLLSVPHVPYTGYTAITIPAIQPPLPEKKRLSSTPGSLNGHPSHQRCSPVSSPTHNVTLPPTMAEQRLGSAQFSSSREDVKVNAKFVQDSSKYWYKPGISRDQAIAVLKEKEPGTFLIRDSNSFQGAYGLALKVATPPPNASITGSKADVLEQLVRHFLIETGPRGVKIKGCQNESYFGSLSALVYQHSITPISLPCALRIPEQDLVGDLQEIRTVTNTSTAADLLKQGAACNVLYLTSVETESLTGPEAVSKATKCTLALSPRPAATMVHFKVSSQGITLTDSKRRLFFRRHYPISSVTFSSLDPQDQRWTNCDSTSSKMFGFVARRTGSATENVCHLFAEMDPDQPAVAIVNFINKVMLGPQLRRCNI
ncbi:tensin-2-like isoform X4 [Phyllopteryx taeniolatus]|uniref:tensin-2-like isoform X4 n=1 Tax=Phyllopteryx taeniolatus TaxID=161469 RepID=UPI002AD56A34|nr:tensin-2-like isoform X4 [Phyllopteryx taeniolatus]